MSQSQLHDFGHSLQDIRGLSSVVLLQECGQWNSDAHIFGFQTYRHDAADTCILVGAELEMCIRNFDSCETFTAVVLETWLVVSLHLLNSWVDKNNAKTGETLESLSKLVTATKAKYRIRFLLVGGDLNTQLPGHTDITGAISTHQTKKQLSSRQLMVMNWLRKHKLKALNSYGDAPDGIGWTHFNNRHQRGIVIDYACVAGCDAMARIVLNWDHCKSDEDHRPVRIFQFSKKMRKVRRDRESMKLWEPSSENASKEFTNKIFGQLAVAENGDFGKSVDISYLQSTIAGAAMDVDYTCGSTKFQGNTKFREEMLDARNRLRILRGSAREECLSVIAKIKKSMRRRRRGFELKQWQIKSVA